MFKANQFITPVLV